MHERLASYHLPVNICGDFNIDIREQNKLAAEFQSAITSNNYSLLSEIPTRITESSSSCIDHFFINDFLNLSIKLIDNETFSDHFLIYPQNFQNHMHEPNKYIFRDMSILKKQKVLNSFFNELSSALAETNWLTINIIEQFFTLFQSCLSDKSNTFAPISSSYKWIPKCGWFT